MKESITSYSLAYDALRHFAGDFGQTAPSSFQFLREIFAEATNFGIKAKIKKMVATFPTLCERCTGSFMVTF